MTSRASPAVHAVVPAAGSGRRFGAGVPKQYLPLAGRPVMVHTLDRLTALPVLARIVVPVAADDARAAALPYARPARLTFITGGAERCDSVLAGVDWLLAQGAADDDWVLVHDVARPLLQADDVERLLAAVQDDAVGGLLAVPVRDTMKRADATGRVSATVPRERLWHALTPQVFRLRTLQTALRSALAAGEAVTDEASAIERLGLQPRLVSGRQDNLKITYAEDLPLAAQLLAAQVALGHTQEPIS